MANKLTKKWLGQLAKAAKLDLEFVEEKCEEQKKEYAHLEGEEFEAAVMYALATQLRAHKKSKAIPVDGVHLGFTKPFDYNFGPKNDQKKELMKLLEEYDTTSPTPEIIERLIEKGYSDPLSPEKIVWLDIKRKFKSGKENKNFGKPWPPAVTTSIMNLVGFGRPSEEVDGESQEMKKYSITISDPDLFVDKGGLNNIELIEPFKLFVPYTGKLLHYPDKSDETTNVFNLSSLTTFEYGDPVDVMDMCKEYLPDHVRTVTSLYEHYEKYGEDRNEFVIFEGGVQNMIMEPSPIGTRKLYVDDPYIDPLEMFTDEGLVPDTLVEVPEHVLIDFMKGSRIVVVGETKQRAKWIRGENGEKGHNSPTEKELFVEALGVYPIPRYSRKVTPAEPVAEPEAKGW